MNRICVLSESFNTTKPWGEFVEIASVIASVRPVSLHISTETSKH